MNILSLMRSLRLFLKRTHHRPTSFAVDRFFYLPRIRLGFVEVCHANI